MAPVIIRDVKKNFGAFRALKGVSVDIEHGQFVVLVGPSGCGKSTLLRMIAGLEEIDGGEIVINERVVNDLLPKERDIAMVFQSYALYPHMTVAQNMGFSLKVRGTPRQERDEKVARAAQILGLETLLERTPKQLSGGQRQRVAMGRAIVRDPVVFLFDEPLSNLDAKLRVQMRAEIKDLHQRMKTTTIYVTHDQIEAMTMADVIVVMRDGVIEQIGSPIELYDEPTNVFVATFIGSPSMNIIEGRVSGNKFVTDDAIELPLSESTMNAEARYYGVRPECFDIVDHGVKMNVKVVEPTGAETMIVGDIGRHTVTCVFHHRLTVRPGEELQVLPRPETEHVFDGQENRIARRRAGK
ncbi:MAG: sn-glycerol-3-phosphate ABC transporter ATP-binding protein UgpC [Nitratireductor sp.]|nr:sn-glycerol-3-phosphate ABC transporter ATP-binding protein UgpC [Nitratireductor sp.]